MEFAKLDGSSPFFPSAAAAVVLAAAGIFFVVLSRNATRKRIVLRLAMAAFSIAVGTAVIGDGRYRDRPLVIGLILLGLLANALYVDWSVQFCADCHATISRSGRGPWRCPDCLAKKGTA